MNVHIKNITRRKITFVREPFTTFGTRAYSKMKKLCLEDSFNLYVGVFARLDGNTNHLYFFICKYNKEKDILIIDFTKELYPSPYPHISYPSVEQKEQEVKNYRRKFNLEQMISLFDKEEEEI